MIPWTAEFVADEAAKAVNEDAGGRYTVENVMNEARLNAKAMYGV